MLINSASSYDVTLGVIHFLGLTKSNCPELVAFGRYDGNTEFSFVGECAKCGGPVTVAGSVCVKPVHAEQVFRALEATWLDVAPAEIDFDESGEECCTDCK